MSFENTIPLKGRYITADGIKLKNGDTFPVLENGDKFYYGDYVYAYNENNAGWEVSVKNKNKTEYEEILNSINNIPVTSLHRTFLNCAALIKAPEIPNSITNMWGTFFGCESLETAPKISNKVKHLNWTFFDCKSLKIAPKIPNSVANMIDTFNGCLSLIEAPKMPDGVINMESTFRNCTLLAGSVTIPKSASCLYGTFINCKSLKTITFNNPDTDIQLTFDNNAKLKIKGLSLDNIKQAKKMYPNISFNDPSKLSEFLENERNGGKYGFR